MSIDSIPLWEWCWVAYSTISAILHLIILVIIMDNRMKSDKSFFHGSFFLICVIQGSQEIIMYLITTFVNRFRKYRIVLYEVCPDNVVVEWEYYVFIFIRNNLYVGHILVAANRLTAFHFTTPNGFARFWQTRTVLFLFGTGYLIMVLARLYNYSPAIAFPTRVDNVSDIFGFTPDPIVDRFDTITEISLSLGTTATCIVLYILTGIKARKRLSLLQERNKKREIVLFRCAVATFVMLALPAGRSIIHLTALVTQDPILVLWTQRQMSMTTETMFVFQPLLLIISIPQLREKLWDVLFPQTTTVQSTTVSMTQTNNSSSDFVHRR